jgi:flagellar hook assembly protein FlgD
LNLSEDQFNAFSDAENQAKSAELISQLASLKQVARAVIQTGEDAAAKGDTAQARKCFTSLEQCGAAMNTTNSGHLVQLVGQAFQKRAKSELAKIGQ